MESTQSNLLLQGLCARAPETSSTLKIPDYPWLCSRLQLETYVGSTQAGRKHAALQTEVCFCIISRNPGRYYAAQECRHRLEEHTSLTSGVCLTISLINEATLRRTCSSGSSKSNTVPKAEEDEVQRLTRASTCGNGPGAFHDENDDNLPQPVPPQKNSMVYGMEHALTSPAQQILLESD